MRNLKILPLALLCASWVSSASAWDRVGHLVVDAVAWEHMSATTRARAVELLRSAPTDADLALFGVGPRELFVRSGYWPDVVRDEGWPARKEKHDRPTWHYVNYFWREDGTEVPEMGRTGELVERLDVLAQSVPDAIDLAWMMHLVGDIHQPLHSSARVTSREPNGDRGGNDFTIDALDAWGNLHGYWDGIQRRARPKRHSEGYPAWIDRITREIMTAHPRADLEGDLAAADFESWAKAGAELARTRLYPSYLVRDARPPRRYQDEALEMADRQLALAGYRLAALLNELLD